MKALLLGYYGEHNLGDEMMLFCLSKWLFRQGIQVRALSEAPQELHEEAVQNIPLFGQWGWYDAWFRGRAVRLIRSLAAHDILIGGGGDCIRDDRGWRHFSFSIEKYAAALLLGKRIALLNVGIGRPRSRRTRIVLAWILRHSSPIVVRDHRSLEVCAELGIRNVRFAPDIVISLPRVLSGLPARPPAQQYVLVCLRCDPNAYSGYDLTESRAANLAAALGRFASNHGLKILFMPFQSSPRGIDDNRVHRAVAAHLPDDVGREILDWTSDLTEVCRLISGARCVVAMRLHAAVLAVAFERPCAVMPYDIKVAQFRDHAGIACSVHAAHLDATSPALAAIESSLCRPAAYRVSAAHTAQVWDALHV